MKKQTPRSDRIASKVQTIVAEILRDKFGDDPILSTVSLVGSESSSGLNFVRLYYYSHNAPDSIQQKLDSVTKTIRYELASRLNQKYTPEIKFTYDDTMDRAARIEELLKSL